jgi:DNA recombination protein RmuC
MEIILLIIGLAVGAAGAFVIAKYKYSSQTLSLKEAEILKQQADELNTAKLKAEERNTMLSSQYEEIKNNLENERSKVISLSNENSKIKADYQNLDRKLTEQKDELEQLHQKFSAEFKILANDILEDKSKKFTEQNKTNLDDILRPLSEKIKDFEKKVNDVYVTDSKDRASLSEQIRNLHELNQQMSKDANNLTKALKGDSKTQGNWGEFILERILEKSSLVKDSEYIVQTSFTSEDGKRQRPDVIIKLPENKHIIIDSKTSLTAYESYCSCENDEERDALLSNHINSIRSHIRELNIKSYQTNYELQSLDFVLMFIPVEPAFGIAMQKNPELFEEALEKNIVIVCPSTLLATLRTISNIWKQERRNRHALDIAKEGGDLYDKFVGFTNDLLTLGKQLEDAQKYYKASMNKLSDGSGNLIHRVENLKKLGAKAQKSIDQRLLDRADPDSEPSILNE